MTMKGSSSYFLRYCNKIANSRIVKCIYTLSETNCKECHTVWLTFKSFAFLDFSVGVWMLYIAKSVYWFCVNLFRPSICLVPGIFCCSLGVAHACSTLKTFSCIMLHLTFTILLFCVFFIFSIQVSPSPVILNQCFSFHVIIWLHGNIG